MRLAAAAKGTPGTGHAFQITTYVSDRFAGLTGQEEEVVSRPVSEHEMQVPSSIATTCHRHHKHQHRFYHQHHRRRHHHHHHHHHHHRSSSAVCLVAALPVARRRRTRGRRRARAQAAVALCSNTGTFAVNPSRNFASASSLQHQPFVVLFSRTKTFCWRGMCFIQSSTIIKSYGSMSDAGPHTARLNFAEV
jgi:hypothetical protein